MDNPIRHIGKDRLAGSLSEDDPTPPKSELEAEEELVKEWNKEERKS